ncbi:isoflavone reductase family protein [Diplodia corticola]|uniref:Isoflavone reductase family protein n=1 Tax=Diplodia corticola TaxID=236234 RepID=A0A1J9QRF4_9PEZI|nr:isoflavone reductase family protein [Diplodia corticola]OJD30594.1 isoflavone reductase family protein [Diplodia corticola]
MVKQRVLLLGATGNTGESILNGLLEHGAYEVQILVRPSSAEKPEVKKIAERGVKVVIADINGPTEELVSIQTGVDVTISAIDAMSQLAQMNLATAAKKAGVKRFVPCAWTTVAPAGGVMVLRDHKEEVYNHIKRLYLPYTVIDVGFWHQISFPTSVPSRRFDYAVLMPQNTVHGDGEQPTIISDLRDLGRWTARIIEDERTLNKYVFTCSDVLSENQISTIVEEMAGEKPERKQVSYEEVEAAKHEARIKTENEPDNFMNRIRRFEADYHYSKYVRGDNQPEYAKYLGYLDARELYPDFRPITFREFMKDLLDGKIQKPRFNFA